MIFTELVFFRRHSALFALAVAAWLAWVPAARSADPALPFDREAMIGSWQFYSGVKAGEELAKERLAASIEITKDSITLSSMEGKFVIGYDLDITKKPATMDMTIKDSPFGAGAKAKAIVELRDGDLVLAYNPTQDADAASYPTEMVSTAENGLFLFRLSRRRSIDPMMLIGRWSIEQGKKAGEGVPAERMAGTIEITADTITLQSDVGKFVFEYKLDTSVTPAKLDMTTKESPFGEGSKTKGRLDVVDGKIILGYVGSGEVADYPPNLASTADNRMHVFHLKKAE